MEIIGDIVPISIEKGWPKKVLFWPFVFDFCLKIWYNTPILASRLT